MLQGGQCLSGQAPLLQAGAEMLCRWALPGGSTFQPKPPRTLLQAAPGSSQRQAHLWAAQDSPSRRSPWQTHVEML